jgi:hypothetical protein
MIDKAA